MESQFTGSSKAYASTLIKKLFNEKYTGGGIREHILKMSSTASKLKPMDLGLKDEFLIHLVSNQKVIASIVLTDKRSL